MRAAVYWAPAPADPLWAAGCAWLGRDAETGATCRQPDMPGIAALTADPRCYGFHATLRPPMRLATDWDGLRDAVRAIARRQAPFALPALEVADLGGFLALRESAPCPALRSLADCCVELTDRHRLAPGADELARRRAAGLSGVQEALLQRWGYPYVMSEWFFHMTLTRRLSAAERGPVLAAARRHFEAVLAGPRRVFEICISTQMDGDFLIAERWALEG